MDVCVDVCGCVWMFIGVVVVARTDLFFFSAYISTISREFPSLPSRPLPATPTLVIYSRNGRGPQEGSGQFGGGWRRKAEGRRQAGRLAGGPRSKIYRQSGEVRVPCSQ